MSIRVEMTSRCKGNHGVARQRAGRRRLHVAAYHQARLYVPRMELKLVSFDAFLVRKLYSCRLDRMLLATLPDNVQIKRNNRCQTTEEEALLEGVESSSDEGAASSSDAEAASSSVQTPARLGEKRGLLFIPLFNLYH